MDKIIKHYLSSQCKIINSIPERKILEAVNFFKQAYLCGKKVFVIGNGGSSAIAEHFVCDLKKTIFKENSKLAYFDVISLVSNNSLLTAIANDHGYDKVFSNQIKNFISKDDILVIFSVSGDSTNIVEAARISRGKGAKVVSFLGRNGGKVKKMSDISLIFSSSSYSLVEGSFSVYTHLITDYLKFIVSQSQRAVFIDRDGVLNKKPPKHDYVKNFSEFVWNAGSMKLIKAINNLGFLSVVVTNQRGVARKLMTGKFIENLHIKMNRDLSKIGTKIDAFYYCPHGLNRCNCRKPQAGMLFSAAKDLNIRLKDSYLIGDSHDDELASINAGCRFIKVDSDKLDVTKIINKISK